MFEYNGVYASVDKITHKSPASYMRINCNFCSNSWHESGFWFCFRANSDKDSNEQKGPHYLQKWLQCFPFIWKMDTQYLVDSTKIVCPLQVFRLKIVWKSSPQYQKRVNRYYRWKNISKSERITRVTLLLLQYWTTI